MRHKKINKKSLNKTKLVLAMSAIVFILIAVSSFGVFSVYALVYTVPFLDIEMLPRHSAIYILGVMSILIGILLSVLFRKFVLVPLYNSYTALGQVSEGEFNVQVQVKGIRAVRNVARSLNAMAKELENTRTMRNDFVNNFSHEFKTPIISISGFAKMLKDKKLTEQERQEYLNIIINESERLSQLSTNVLNLTRLNNQTIVANKTKFNVSEQIRNVIILLEHKWSEKNIEINFECDEYHINASEELLQQLWINLVDNAIKFSPKNSKITIGITSTVDSLVFTVEDTGKGMDENTAKHAFDSFFQGDLSHKSSGNGIGLAISKRICELHEGSIEIKRTDKSGTVFEVMLPG